MNQKFLISIVLTSSIVLSACSLFGSNTSVTPTPTAVPSVATPTSSSVSTTKKTTPSNDSFVAINTKDGQIVLKLYRQQAPNTVANFTKKADTGFYNGLTFHRVIAGFMAQGGDPTGTGQGGGTQKSELNNIPFVRGSIGLARTPDSKEISNASQFFICFSTDQCQQLTGDYVNFGEVVTGLDVLDKISQGDKIISITSRTK